MPACSSQFKETRVPQLSARVRETLQSERVRSPDAAELPHSVSFEPEEDGQG